MGAEEEVTRSADKWNPLTRANRGTAGGDYVGSRRHHALGRCIQCLQSGGQYTASRPLQTIAVMTTNRPNAVSLAIIGAGPAGLSLALQAAQALPHARITVFDARPADKDISGDARTLALSQGTVQELQRMGIWDAIETSGRSAPILEVHVSQQQPTVLWPGQQQPEGRI